MDIEQLAKLYIISSHEVGHALVAFYYRKPLRRISMIPNGRRLGVVESTADEFPTEVVLRLVNNDIKAEDVTYLTREFHIRVAGAVAVAIAAEVEAIELSGTDEAVASAIAQFLTGINDPAATAAFRERETTWVLEWLQPLRDILIEIANELIEKRAMSGKQIEKLMRAAGVPQVQEDDQ